MSVSVLSAENGTLSPSLTSIGYNLVMGLLVIPVEVRILAVRTSLSLPTSNSSTTAIFQVALGLSS